MMASRKGFKPPVKKQVSSSKPSQVKDGWKALSDSQYEEIFDAVVHFQGNRSPVQAESMKIRATEPGESASTGNSQSSQANPDDCARVDSETQVSAAKQSVTSQILVQKRTDSNTSSIAHKRPRTFREALKLQESSSQLSSSQSQLASGSLVFTPDAALSQAPKILRHRQRLQWLQDRRGVGLYIQCDVCKKWRWSDIDDPVDVSKKWSCRQNPDVNYNACIIPEKPISIYVEEDLIHNDYTAGSVVWAKLFGYPWWPAMVDDCPDTEQYYWLDGYSDIPTHYHVVFFDNESKETTRCWVDVRDLISFKHQPALDNKFSLKPGHKSRITCAKVQAHGALKLRVKERLQRYSFLARWTGEIVTPPPSDAEQQETAAAKRKGAGKRRKRSSRKKPAVDSSDEELEQRNRRKRRVEKNCQRSKDKEDSYKKDEAVVDEEVDSLQDKPAAASADQQTRSEVDRSQAMKPTAAELDDSTACSGSRRSLSEQITQRVAAIVDSKDFTADAHGGVAVEEEASVAGELEHVYSQDSSMESFALQEEECKFKQQHVTQTLLDEHVDIFENSVCQEVEEEDDVDLKRLREHITKSQLTARDVNVPEPVKRRGRMDRDGANVHGDGSAAAGVEPAVSQSAGKENKERRVGEEKRRRIGKKLNKADFVLKRRASSGGSGAEGKRQKIAREQQGKGGASAKSDSKPGTSDSRDAKSDGKPARDAMLASGDTQGANSDSKPASGDTTDAKPGKDAKSDSKPVRDTKDTNSDSKLARSDTNAVSATKVAKSDTTAKNGKRNTKDAKSDSKLTKDTKPPKTSTKIAKIDTKLAKNDTKVSTDGSNAKSDATFAKSDTKPTETVTIPAKGDTKPAKTNSKSAKDTKLAKSDTKPAKSVTKSDTKPTSSDTSKPSTSGLNNTTKKRFKRAKLFQPPVRKSSASESARSEEHSEPTPLPEQHPPPLLDITSSQSLISSSVAVVPNSEDRLIDILKRLSQESLPFDP